MKIYEKRTYSVTVGRMKDILAIYSERAWPVLERDGFTNNLVGYFISDTGRLHQLIHIWRFEDDAARRKFWERLYANDDFMAVAADLRPLIDTQEVQLMTAAPWGPQP